MPELSELKESLQKAITEPCQRALSKSATDPTNSKRKKIVASAENFAVFFAYLRKIKAAQLNYKHALLIFFCLACSISAERLPVKTYTVADGLPRDRVSRIRQDSRGFLWFCTLEGISRFDGVGMTNFTVADGLPDRLVKDFLETKSGKIYLATGKGLARLNPQGARGSQENPLFTVFLPDNPKASEIQTLYEDKNNQIWVGTSDGLYKLTDTDGILRFENVPLGEPLESSGGAVSAPGPNALSVNSILEDRRGTFWIGTYGGGLFRLSAENGVRRYTTENDTLRDNKITDLLEASDGRIWMSLRSDENGGVCLLDAENAENPVKKCYTEEDGLGSNWVRDMFETSDGQLWLATAPGLCRWQDGGAAVCKTYNVVNDLCDDMLSIAEDKDGNLWTGSSCGVQKIARYGFTTYDTTDGLNSAEINSIFENAAGDFFAVTYPEKERVIGQFNGDKVLLVRPQLPASVNYHGYGWRQTVWQDSAGAWWIPTGLGLYRSPDNTSFDALARAPLEKLETGAKNTEVFRLFEDSRGDVWIATHGTSGELLRWERATDKWLDYTVELGFSGFRIGTAFEEDKTGSVWIGATSEHDNSALIRYRQGEFRIFTESEGAPSGWIQDLFLDSRGRLWIATDKDGVWRLDDPANANLDFVKYTSANGLISDSTTSVTEDEFGRFYIGTWHGIDRLTPETGQIENFTTADGLPSSYIESAHRDRKNNLWFATDKGLVRFVPEPVRQRRPPTILITGLRVNGEQKAVSILGETSPARLELPSDQRQITVDFLGLGASLGEKLKYEYRFGGGDWTPTGERTLNFANLAAGDYRFEVRAQTADGIYSQTANAQFKIAAPVWQSWWFATGILSLTGLIIYWFYRFRLARLLEIERTRTRIATDLHDDIGTNLAKISLLSEIVNMQFAEENKERNQLLNTIAETSRESVAAMSDIVWTINPKSDSLIELIWRMRQHAEEIFVEKGVRVKFNTSEEDKNLSLSMHTRRELYLIFKEAVNNAAKHAGCANIEIDFYSQNGKFFLRVKDDGRGFDDAQKSDGNGLRNMRVRAEKMNARIEIESALSRGTTVSVSFPQS